MMRYTLPILAAWLGASLATAQPGPLRGALEEATGGGANRNDVEGGVWEYKVISRTRDKPTMLVGKIRVKQGAAFDVAGSAKGQLLAQGGDAEAPDEGGSFPFGIKAPTARRLGVRDRVAEGNRGGERIGDITYSQAKNTTTTTPKVSFKFDSDDDHPLSGEAMVKHNRERDGDVWKGTYYQFLDSGEKKRWNFELRFIED